MGFLLWASTTSFWLCRPASFARPLILLSFGATCFPPSLREIPFSLPIADLLGTSEPSVCSRPPSLGAPCGCLPGPQTWLCLLSSAPKGSVGLSQSQPLFLSLLRANVTPPPALHHPGLCPYPHSDSGLGPFSISFCWCYHYFSLCLFKSCRRSESAAFPGSGPSGVPLPLFSATILSQSRLCGPAVPTFKSDHTLPWSPEGGCKRHPRRGG